MRFSHEQIGPFWWRERGVALHIPVRVLVLLTCWAVAPAFSVSVIGIAAALWRARSGRAAGVAWRRSAHCRQPGGLPACGPGELPGLAGKAPLLAGNAAGAS